MSNDYQAQVTITISIQLDDLSRDFTAAATVDGGGCSVADGMLGGLRDDAREWLWKQRKGRTG